MIQGADRGESRICSSPEANDKRTAAGREAVREAVRDERYLLMILETALDGILKAAQEAKTAKTNVILNPAPARELPDELLKCVDLITPNETEAEVLTGITVYDDS
ncbi:PfkB family carbohydrate kinase, partial [Escherichia coli]|uniref:PfkB family carbohydrate kinase n=1 Tax=Escherichia coli TaxID=562 RepID=UPI00207CECBC